MLIARETLTLLQELPVLVVSNQQCGRAYITKKSIIKPTQLCAGNTNGNKKQDACQVFIIYI